MVQGMLPGELLTVEELGEGVHGVILVMNIDNIDGVIGKVVVDDELLA